MTNSWLSSPLLAGLVAAFGVAVIAALSMLLRAERRAFAQRNKAASWLKLRLAAIPIAALTAAAVALPARSLGSDDLEALAAIYMLAFTAGPVSWFGLHLLTGRLLRPALTGHESFLLALTLPGFVIVAATVGSQLYPLAVLLARWVQGA